MLKVGEEFGLWSCCSVGLGAIHCSVGCVGMCCCMAYRFWVSVLQKLSLKQVILSSRFMQHLLCSSDHISSYLLALHLALWTDKHCNLYKKLCLFFPNPGSSERSDLQQLEVAVCPCVSSGWRWVTWRETEPNGGSVCPGCCFYSMPHYQSQTEMKSFFAITIIGSFI